MDWRGPLFGFSYSYIVVVLLQFPAVIIFENTLLCSGHVMKAFLVGVYERNAVLEYVESDSGITQVFSQDGVDEAALFRRDGCAFAKLVFWVLLLFFCELVCKNILDQFFERIVVLCSSGVCSSTLGTMQGDPSAPVDKVVLLRNIIFIAVHKIPAYVCYGRAL